MPPKSDTREPAEPTKSTRERVHDLLSGGKDKGKDVATGGSAVVSALLLHGLPLLAHVLPHTPQLFARFLLLVTSRDKEADADATAPTATGDEPLADADD